VTPAPHIVDGADAQVFEQLFDASPVAMVVTTLLRDSILAVNTRATEVFGVSKQDAVRAKARTTT